MRATRLKWWLPVILAVFGLGYLIFRNDAPDITEDLRTRLRSASGSVSRVIYLEDVARDFLSSNWSIACVVQPYATSGDETPEALRRAWWVGNWNESEWRIAFLDDRSLLQSFIVKHGPFKVSERSGSGSGSGIGIGCITRERNPVLRISRELSGAFLVELGSGDAR